MPASRLTCVVALLLLGGPIAARGEERLGSTPRAGVLLLRNGQALHGKIALVGEQYVVIQDGAEFHVKSSEAECYCRDLDDAYESRRAKLPPGKALEHIGLAEWCLRHGLNGYAASELAEAMAIDPKHPKIPLLERRLKLAVSQPSQPAAAGPARAAPSNDDLDRLTRSLPAGAMETFTTTIQPLLLNHCATAGCHGPTAKDELRLGRSPGRQPLTRRLTQRNLAAAMKLLDRDQPDASPLLRMAAEPHGTAKMAPLGDQDSGPLRQLEYWIGRVVARQEPAGPAKVPESTPLAQFGERLRTQGGLRGAAKPDADGSNSEVQDQIVEPPADDDMLDDVNEDDSADDAKQNDPDGLDSAADSDTASTSETPSADGAPSQGARRPRARRPPQRGRAVESFVPIDPFDPEVFNRKYAPK